MKNNFTKNRIKTISLLNCNDTIFIILPSKLNTQKNPEGMESLMIRIYISEEVEDTGKMRVHYYKQTMKYLEKITGEDLLKHVVYKKSYAQTDYEVDYYTYKGKAYGWLNSMYLGGKIGLKMRNQSLSNLYYAEFPAWLGSDIPSALVSGKYLANEIVTTCERTDSN